MENDDNKKSATLIAVDLCKTLIMASLMAFVAAGAFLRFTQVCLSQIFLIVSMILFIVSCFKGGQAIADVYKKANACTEEPWNPEEPQTKRKFSTQAGLALLGLLLLGAALVIQIIFD